MVATISQDSLVGTLLRGEELENCYTGDTRDGLRHGKGRYTYPNKFFSYEGDWVKGVKQGKGIFRLGDGGYYEGDFRADEMTGDGVRVWPDGRKYKGTFLDGHLHGQGEMEYANGDVYVGRWETNQRQGEGTLTYSSGDRYQGNFVAHFPHGLGTLTSKDGSVYEGEWLCGQQGGSGACRYANGDVYEGVWEAGRWLNGRWYQPSTNITYEGRFEDGAPTVRPTVLHVLKLEMADASSEEKGSDARPTTSSGGVGQAVPSLSPGQVLPRVVVGCLSGLPTLPVDADTAISPRPGAKAGAKGPPPPAKAAPKTPRGKGSKDAAPAVGLVPSTEELVKLESAVVTGESGRKIVATLHVGSATAGPTGVVELGRRIPFLSSSFPPSHELVALSSNGLVVMDAVGVPADCDGGPYTICFRNVIDESFGIVPLQQAYLAIQVDGPTQPKGAKPVKKAPATSKK